MLLNFLGHVLYVLRPQVVFISISSTLSSVSTSSQIRLCCSSSTSLPYPRLCCTSPLSRLVGNALCPAPRVYPQSSISHPGPLKCGFIAVRDTVGAMNTWLRALRVLHVHAGVPWSPPRAPNKQ